MVTIWRPMEVMGLVIFLQSREMWTVIIWRLEERW
jgi:hypothetical protein